MANDNTKHCISVAVKFAVLASSAAAVFCAVAIWTGYSSMSVFLKDSAGYGQKKMAELMTSSINKAVDENIESYLSCAVRDMKKNAPTAQPESGEEKPPTMPVLPLTHEASFGDITFDEPSGRWVLPLTIKLLDKSGNTIDTQKSLLGIDVFYNPLKEFGIGDTGHAALVDSRTYLIFSPGAKPFINKFCSYNELQKACCEKSGWFIMDGVYGYAGKVFAAFCRLDHPLLLKKGIKWWVFVVRDEKEVFEPLKKLIIYGIMGSILLISALAVLGFMLGKFLVRPVRKLDEGLERLGSGDFKYRVSVDSGDELGDLEASFNAMAQKLSDTATSKVNLDIEADHRRKAEEKVKQLAEELQKAFDAMKASAGNAAAAQSGNMKDFLKKADKLIDLSKIEGDKIELNIKNLDMRELIKRSIFYFEPKIREKNLDLRIEIPKNPVSVEADSERIKQVLSILLNNAVRFTDKGYVAIIAKESADAIECGVLNTGSGIPYERLSRMFDDLHNINLSIAKGIVEKHGGHIWVEIEPGNVTRISFKLPKKQK